MVEPDIRFHTYHIVNDQKHASLEPARKWNYFARLYWYTHSRRVSLCVQHDAPGKPTLLKVCLTCWLNVRNTRIPTIKTNYMVPGSQHDASGTTDSSKHKGP